MATEMDLEKGIEEEISKKTQSLLDEQKNEQNDRDQQSPSICIVPNRIRAGREANFKCMIGIGALNIVYSDQRPVDVKIRYMFDLFGRLKSPPDDIRNECVRKVYSRLNDIKACYVNSFDRFNSFSREICLNIVFDACYILSLIHKWSEYDKQKGSSNPDELLVSLQTKRDLIVLDNQIPFFVLQDLFKCTILKIVPTPTASLVELILSFLKEIIPFEANSITDGTGKTDYKHILDLVYKTYQPPDARSSDRLSTVTTTYSAVELRKAGVKFKPYQGDKWEMAFKFNSSWSNTTLTMPAMRIEESTVPVLWNLAAYERCFPEVGYYIASYSFAMMMIVGTKEDLLELGESKIIRNLNGHQYFMDLIHDLCKGVVLKDFSFAKEWRKMDKHCNSRLGYTRRTYFSGAWSYIASISALILFILTAVQTYCSIRAL